MDDRSRGRPQADRLSFFIGALATNLLFYLVIVPALSGIGLLFAFLPVLGFFTNG
ncbi:MAG: hypothetical protein JO137_06360, partial [Hyphomicrobiales bacterium]|nr:hypothetical protein [Hyphomicrobiales bacterium]